MSHETTYARGRRWRAAPGMSLGLALATLFLVGCDSLLEVDLPGTVGDDAIRNPAGAEVLVNSVIAQVECSYSRFVAGKAAGTEDVFQRMGSGGQHPTGFAEYQEVAQSGNTCDTGGDDGYNWEDPLQTARFFAEDFYALINGYSDSFYGPGVLVNFKSRQEMLAVIAMYAAIPYQLFGEVMCEQSFSFAENYGDLLAPDSVLGRGERWATTAIGLIAALPGGDMQMPFAITPVAGQNSARQMAYGLRARIRWARGNLTGADLDAQQVNQGFMAYVTREGGVTDERENHVWLMHYFRKYGPVVGPIDWWAPVDRTNPVSSPAPGFDPWPNPLPFTGYLNLAFEADGRAIGPVGVPVTMTNTGVTADTRVSTTPNQALFGGTGFGARQNKYTTVDQPIPLVNWREMWLIRAEANPGSAVARVNEVRGALPPVTYAPAGEEITNMIIEERRRALWLEGRFLATKILNTDRLWFPRTQGGAEVTPAGFELGGMVRMVMQEDEFELNPKFSLADRATLCDVDQRPFVNTN